MEVNKIFSSNPFKYKLAGEGYSSHFQNVLFERTIPETDPNYLKLGFSMVKFMWIPLNFTAHTIMEHPLSSHEYLIGPLPKFDPFVGGDYSVFEIRNDEESYFVVAFSAYLVF